ncbi:MAG: hypothetical protein WDO06_01135 [Actinomycetota bacterium]
MSLTVQYFRNRKARSYGHLPNRPRSYYLLLLSIDALVIFSIVTVVSLIADIKGVNNRTAISLANYRSENLGYSGLAKINLAQLQSQPQVDSNSDLRFWLGPKDGYTYSIESDIPGELTIRYIAPDQSLADAKLNGLSVTIFENEMFYSRSLLSLDLARPFSFENSEGDVLAVDASNFVAVKVSLKASVKIALIHYPNIVNIETVLRDSALLTAIPLDEVSS